MTLATPPPSHIVCNPYFLPCAFSAWTSVDINFVPDAPSGFRAFSRNAAQKINVFSSYTYTLETIIQAGHKNITIASVDISVNDNLRKSRLVQNIPSYIRQSIITATRIFIAYRPLRFFSLIGGLIFSAGLLIGLRFIFYYALGSGEGHIQSLILSAVLLLIGFQIIMIGIVADLISVNRKLLEKVDWKLSVLMDDNSGKSDE